MFQVTNLTAAGVQTTTAILADGSAVSITFRYRAAIQRWAIDIAYKTYSQKGKILSTHPNLLRVWRTIIPFGLQITTVDGTDPFMASDLDCSGGQIPRVKIFILDQTAGKTDVTNVEISAFGAAPSLVNA